MPLNWDCSNMVRRLGEARYHHITTHPIGRDGPEAGWTWHPVTERLVGYSLTCGFDEITEANAVTVAQRIATLQSKTAGLYLCKGDDSVVPVYLTVEDVWNHIGLTTNAATRSDREFEHLFGAPSAPRFGLSAHEIYERHMRDENEPDPITDTASNSSKAA